MVYFFLQYKLLLPYVSDMRVIIAFLVCEISNFKLLNESLLKRRESEIFPKCFCEGT